MLAIGGIAAHDWSVCHTSPETRFELRSKCCTRFRVVRIRFGGRAFAADVDVQLAEVLREAAMRREVDRLLAEEEDAILAQRVLERTDLLLRERLREIDIADLGADARRERRDGDRGRGAHAICGRSR
jgi:hypothetical protein